MNNRIENVTDSLVAKNVTKNQLKSLKRIWKRDSNGMSYKEFRAKAQYGIPADVLMVPWCGMWIGIEQDGYTHS